MKPADATSLTNGTRVWDAATGELLTGEPIDPDVLERELMAQLNERARRARELGAEVLESCATHLPDGTVVREERGLTMAQLRAECHADEAVKIEVARLRREGLALMATDRAKGVAMVTAASRFGRERHVERRQRVQRETTTTIVRPPKKIVSPAAAPAPVVASGTATSAATPRERHATSRGRARAPDDDPSDPDAAARRCGCGCGLALPPGKRGYVDDAHSNRARQRRHKARQRAAGGMDARYRDEIAKARRSGELTADEALELLGRDADEARERLLRAAPKHLHSSVLGLFAAAA